MFDQFKLSVVIPNLDRAVSLVRAVQSVRDDSPEAEIVVVDDCSQADLSAEYGRLQAEGVLIFRQPVRMRGGAARNRGVREATGTHVSFLDSDDVWMPGRHDRIRDFFAQPGTEKTVLISAALLHIDGEIRHPYQPPWRDGSTLVDYAYRDMGRVQTSMLNMPRQMVLDCPWNEELRVNQDTDLAMRLDRAGASFQVDPEPGVIKEESPSPTRLTNGRETADRSHAWYRRESGDWSAAAKSGYHLQDRVWRLADSGRNREAFVALARSLVPPVSPRETARRALSMLAGPALYARMRRGYRAKSGADAAVDPALAAQLDRWRDLDARAQAFCDDAKSGKQGTPPTMQGA
ncbi:glycosyltransferase [Paracoccus sp. 1_MG-2023]|uniref:glycosyltransferase family 2 protein n=1 Tax=unclassified Paracoccus (in: a-proteobacteria) TaxID=2688777 RepID=UPI001C0933C6|nr:MULTISPECIES: glycosyltransferase [unclassified Paracoccus (in: a-proteobacteria)]MBU2957923.1 glycosyltransferase [Paracoccus sp. C2R09]MDO6668884.1 glycosyltransferase [Paracoccus sp. 1_MG-2023]